MSTQIEEKNVLHIPDHTGDTRIMWDPRNPDEVATAKAAFKAAQKQGMTAFAVNTDGSANEGEIIREFNKDTGKIIMVKQLQGG